MTTLRPSKAPNLPAAAQNYNPLTVEQINNALRIYFNEVDNLNAALLTATGGGYLGLPHVAASDSTDQYADGNDTPTIVKWNTLDSGNGFTLNANNTATALVSGIYKIDYSLQLANTSNTADDVIVWLQVEGVDVANSASRFTMPARKSSGTPSYIVAYSSIVFQLLEGQSVGLWWATPLAYNPVGPVDGVYILHDPAQTSPYAHPAIPSAIGSITFVSRINP
jgi:hypothetical protein